MRTLLDIKIEAASLLAIAPSSLTVNGVDLFINAANSARRFAEMNYDLEFTRKAVTLTVNGATGGDLLNAEDLNGNPVSVKSVIEVGLSDSSGNLTPVIWTTVAESLERQRQDVRSLMPRQPTDAQLQRRMGGLGRFAFAGTRVNVYPREEAPSDTNYALGLEVYSFGPDWITLLPSMVVTGAGYTTLNGSYYPQGTWNEHVFYMKINSDGAYFLYWDTDSWHITQANNLGSMSPDRYTGAASNSQSPVATGYVAEGVYTGTADVAEGVNPGSITNVWTNQGYNFILWHSIITLNHRFKTFVPRTEGNLPPPTDMMQGALTSLLEWDTAMFEQFRRHSR